jgi:hypothetical protein
MTSQPDYQPGDRIALVATDDPGTRLRPGDQGTVTRRDPAQGQFSDCSAPLMPLNWCFTSMTCP